MSPVWCLKCATNFCHQSLHHESCLASFMTDAVNPHSEPPARQRVNARLLISQLIVTVSSFKGWFCQNHHLSSWLMNQCWHTAGLKRPRCFYFSTEPKQPSCWKMLKHSVELKRSAVVVNSLWVCHHVRPCLPSGVVYCVLLINYAAAVMFIDDCES